MKFRMFRPVSPFFLLIMTGLVLSLSGCAPPALGITSIQHLPDLPAEGSQVVFNVDYHNNSDQNNYESVSLEVSYAPELSFVQANPLPALVDASARKMSWALGSLQTGQGGSVQVTFVVAKGFPRETYRLDVTAQISGKDAQGQLISHQRTGWTGVEGHPTPTPLPTIPPTQGGSKLEGSQTPSPPILVELNDFGDTVKVELPWQGQELHIVDNHDFPDTLLEYPVEGNLRPIWKIIHFEVVDSAEREVNTFSPPMTITIFYTSKDLEYVSGDPAQLVLVLLDHEKKIWYPRDIELDSTSRTAKLSIASWHSHMSWTRK